MRCSKVRLLTAFFMGLVVTMAVIPMSAFAAKPNILFIMSDDGIVRLSEFDQKLAIHEFITH